MHKDLNSVYDEPQFRDFQPKADSSESKTDRLFSRKDRSVGSEDQIIEQSVWDEPAISDEIKGSNENLHLTYSGWLTGKISAMSVGRSWLITVAVALCAGPWAVLGALFTGYSDVRFFSAGIIAVSIIGPLTEEFMKIAIPLYIAEKRPFYFKSKWQVFGCVMAGGLVFSVIENLIYIHIYIKDPTMQIIIWRWTVCTLMHVSATSIAGLGIMRMWADSSKNLSRPQLPLTYPFIISAIAFHGLYNTFAILLSYSGYFKNF